MSQDDIDFIRENIELFDTQYFNQKGVFGVEYETKKCYFVPYERFVNSRFNVVMQHPISKGIVEKSGDSNGIAVLFFRQGTNPRMYDIPTPYYPSPAPNITSPFT